MAQTSQCIYLLPSDTLCILGVEEWTQPKQQHLPLLCPKGISRPFHSPTYLLEPIGDLTTPACQNLWFSLPSSFSIYHHQFLFCLRSVYEPLGQKGLVKWAMFSLSSPKLSFSLYNASLMWPLPLVPEVCSILTSIHAPGWS